MITTPPTTMETRSPADVLRLAVGVVLLVAVSVVTALFGDTLAGFTSDLLRGIDAVPDWLTRTLVVLVRLVCALALLAGIAWTALHTGTRMVVSAVVAVVAGVVVLQLLDAVLDVDRAAPPVDLDGGLGPVTHAAFPTASGIAAMAAAVSAAAPWLSRRWRRWGWVAVVGLVATRFLTAPLTFDSVTSALVGWTAGSAVLVVLGAPSRRPTAESIRAGLDRSGLALADLHPASVDARGSTPYFGTGVDGARYFVKALGDDQRSADLLFRAYRWLQRKDLGDERPFSSLRRAVEHEAFVALAARDLGVLTPRVAAFATAEPNGFVLAYEAVDGSSLDGVPPEAVDDDVLDQIWSAVAHLRRFRLAHRDLRLANLFLADDGRIWMIDFGFSELAASDVLLANDVAELVASSSTVVGAERATAHARRSVDPATLALARERLQPWALSGASRTALKASPGLIEELRAGLAPT